MYKNIILQTFLLFYSGIYKTSSGRQNLTLLFVYNLSAGVRSYIPIWQNTSKLTYELLMIVNKRRIRIDQYTTDVNGSVSSWIEPFEC